MGAFPVVGATFGRYRIDRLIGQGGMGAVFAARQLDLDRAVALKVLSPHLSHEPDFRARFAREAATLAGLDSPHVIQVYEYGEDEGQLFIATQLVHGADLSVLLTNTEGLAPVEALDLTRQVAAGLGDAHAAGLVHRDVKPSNILVRTVRGSRFAYLCDFGIARPVVSGMTQTGALLGTVGYMAPERHEGADATVASDIYSVGCVLWAALTGRGPYDGASDVQVAIAHIQAPLPQLEGDTSLVRLVNEILCRCLAKRPEERYPSASELEADLRAADGVARGLSAQPDLTMMRNGGLGVETVLRQAPSPAEVGPAAPSRPTRRTGRLAASVLAVAAVLTLGVFAGYTLLNRSETDASLTAAKPASPTVTRQAAAHPAGTPSREPKVVASDKAAARPTASEPIPVPPALAPSDVPTHVVPSAAAAPSKEPSPSLTCWNGATVESAAACSTPTGPAGMAAVFPSFDSACRLAPPRVPGKVEVYECEYGDFMLRYSRWSPTADRFGYLDSANYKPLKYPWSVDFETAGTEYWSEEHNATESKPYQYSAAYANYPFSVSVEGVSKAARRAGVDFLDATPPTKMGLR